MNIKKLFSYFIVLATVMLAGFIWHCKNAKSESDYFTPRAVAVADNGANYVESQTCMECHADIYATHLNTAHYNTSAIADFKNVKGSLEEGSNTFEIHDARITLMEEDGAVYQKSKFKFGPLKEAKAKLDITLGSGVKGQSYLTWEENGLFQLQASYYTPTDSWINSPGYPMTSFTRPISDACLKCHVTFAKNHDPLGTSNLYDKAQVLLGVDCQKCHGPLQQHVAYQRSDTSVKEAKFVTKIDSLSRQKRMDICAQCHSGLRSRQIKGGAFSFLPGENLSDYSKNYGTIKTAEKLDVHGNQVGLLSSSQCFIKSPEMDCVTCHNPHKNERGAMASFNTICTECHQSITKDCTNENSIMNKGLNNDCISCHMPLSPSSTMQIQVNTDSLTEPVYIRTHLIGVYK